MEEPAFQSLYRRYRPQRFGEVRGQDHLTAALRNAVRDGRTSHAYLFSGPRGTGKTSSARILAKALNCTNLEDGEPCCACLSCVAVQTGTSLDVHELDAASNNGVDAIRDLVARAALGTPGRQKVYIVDEVHMLSTPASNALLKTLEEPPSHVVFVLATTDPQKVLATIRSRAQHFEFKLLKGDVLAELLRDVNADAGLGVPSEAIDFVVRRGKGSARDALSAMDQVAAAGHVEDEAAGGDALIEALCDRDAGRVLVSVADACAAGRDPRRMAEELIENLRFSFLLAMNASDLVDLPDDAKDRALDQARRLGNAGLTRVIEMLGQAVIDMRDALEPRITLEVALVRAARPDTDVSPAALLERLERLERAVSGQTTEPARASARAAVPANETAVASAPRVALGAVRRRGALAPDAGPSPPSAAPNAPAVAAPASALPPSATIAGMPSREDLTTAWADVILSQLPGRARTRYVGGRFSAVEDGHAVFALPNKIHRDRCDEFRTEVEVALAAHFGVPVALRLVVDSADGAPVAAPDGEEEEAVAFDDEREAPAAVASPEDRLKQAFPGAQEVEP